MPTPPPAPRERPELPVVTALLTTNVVRTTRGMTQCTALIDEVLALDHVDLETTLWIGDVEFHSTKDGPYPNSQMRVSARPSAQCAALSYTDHDHPDMSIVNSYNPATNPPDVGLIFNGDMGSVFPRSAAIPIADARNALLEWLRTRSLPTCIAWQPFDHH
jgi:hypothetical protein